MEVYNLNVIEKDKEVKRVITKIVKMGEEVQTLQISTTEDEKNAVEFTKQIKSGTKKIDDMRKGFTEGARQFVNQVNNFFMPTINKLKEYEKEIKKKMTIYRLAIERKNQIQQEEAERKRKKEEESYKKKCEKANEKGKELPPIQFSKPIDIPQNIEKTTKTNDASATYKDVKKWELINISEVPREYLILDEKKITKLVKAGIENIPGIRIYETKEISIR